MTAAIAAYGGIENRSTPTPALVGDGAGTKINIHTQRTHTTASDFHAPKPKTAQEHEHEVHSPIYTDAASSNPTHHFPS